MLLGFILPILLFLNAASKTNNNNSVTCVACMVFVLGGAAMRGCP